MSIGSGMMVSSVTSCKSTGVYKTNINDNKINIPLSLFLEKQIQIIRTKELFYDVAVIKNDKNNFAAILMRCTHADNELHSNSNEFICNLHGSRFNLKGEALKGPAVNPLKKYSTEVNGDNLVIHIG